MVFAVHDCGFIPRCALEEDDASQIRIDKGILTVVGRGRGTKYVQKVND